MSTTARSSRIQPFLMTMLLGLVMAALIFVVAGPELSWLGFALAGMYRSSPGGRCG